MLFLKSFSPFLSGNLAAFLAQDFHDIAPPVSYSLVPRWLMVISILFGLTLLGFLGWAVVRRRPAAPAPKSPRQRALEALDRIQAQTETLDPYRFSIRVSDILRRYVTDQYNLPVTRQTSVEFLEHLRNSSPFSEDEKAVLEDFLNRCDLIKFARYEASTVDSRMLLDEATRFVQGGQLATA
jgi:hypothetical protein